MVKSFLALVLLLLTVSTSRGQAVFRVDSIPKQGVLLDKGWRFHPGDNPNWAKVDFDASKWEALDPTTEIAYLPQMQQTEIGWFRLRLSVSPAVLNQSLAVLIGQAGASEIYLNGRLIYRFGVVSAEYAREQTYHLENVPFALKFDPQASQVLAVRYSFNHSNFYINYLSTNPVVRFTLKPANKAFTEYAHEIRTRFGQFVLMCSLFLILSLMYIVLYGSFRAEKAFLWIGIYLLGASLHYACLLLYDLTTDTSTGSILLFIGDIFNASSALFAIFASYVLFGQSRGWFWWFLVGYVLCTIPVLVWSYRWGATFASSFYVIGTTTNLQLMYRGIRNGRVGAWALFGGLALFYVMFFAVIWLTTLGKNDLVLYVSTISVLPIQIGYAIFLAIEFARTSRSLKTRVVEVETLSAQTIAQELEKQQILTTQNETLERQVSERTAELSHKNQELVIEAALERVRSRSLAMHSSEELKEVIALVFAQLNQVDVAITDGSAVIVIFTEGSKDVTHWTVNPELMTEAARYRLPYFDHPAQNPYWEAREKGLDFFASSYTADVKKSYWDQAFIVSDYRYIPEETKQLIYAAPGYAYSIASEKYSALMIDSFSGKMYSERENDILKRFARVFEQAYVRFLDLQKAEAQAREAKIEAALERVRSRSLAMHSSEELKEVITLVFAQLNQLDIAITDGAAVIVLFSEDSKDVIHWTANPGRISEAARFKLPYFDHPMQNFHWDAKEQGLDFVAQAFTLDEKNSFWDQALVVSDYKYGPEETKQWIYASPGYAYSIAIGRHSAILIDSFSGKMYSEQENDILKRFARVFEQAYVRFLDLQKAEAQAREAQIEAALERVRRQSMAMRHSDHLREVITIVSEQLEGLGFQFHYVNFVVEREDSGWDSYNAIPGDIFIFPIPYVDHRLFNDLQEARRQELDFYTYTLTLDEKTEWLTHLFNQTVLKDAPERKQSYMDLPGLATSVVVWPDIALSIATYSGISYTDTENAIFKRFGAVFGQTYTRFLDLKKAEEQARQAIQMASLDRVRAQIASMRTTQDLERITPLIWSELTTLEVPFFRCGVFIINPTQHRIHAFLSTPDGQARAQLDLAIDDTQNSQQIVRSWQNQQVYTDRWSHQQLQDWVASMVEEGQLDSVQEYDVVEEVKDAFSLQFIPFTQGMLYVGSQEPLTNSQLDLTQSLADAFSVAYARYEDFRQLEEAKARVDATLTELKATQTQLIQKEKMASLGELTAGIAHEIQNPLNFVNNFSEVSTELVSELEDEQQKLDRDTELEAEILGDLKQNLQKITHHGGRASAIVRGMLEHSRMGTGEKQLTNLNALADEYLRLAYQGLRAKSKQFNCELVTDFAADLGPVAVVPQEIGRVLLNLYNNAFYAVHEKQKTAPVDYQPTVTVSTAFLPLLGGEGRGEVEIRVEDNGGGIPDAIREKIFQPFFTTKPTGEGTGLGLSLSYDIITKGHGGTLAVKTAPGQFTEFIITLPVA